MIRLLIRLLTLAATAEARTTLATFGARAANGGATRAPATATRCFCCTGGAGGAATCTVTTLRALETTGVKLGSSHTFSVTAAATIAAPIKRARGAAYARAAASLSGGAIQASDAATSARARLGGCRRDSDWGAAKTLITSEPVATGCSRFAGNETHIAPLPAITDTIHAFAPRGARALVAITDRTKPTGNIFKACTARTFAIRSADATDRCTWHPHGCVAIRTRGHARRHRPIDSSAAARAGTCIIEGLVRRNLRAHGTNTQTTRNHP
jgi:hypothetical protein